MQFGAKPLFSDVSVKFGGGNRYGLIGANGCGKSTFMKILGGELEPSAGSVAIDANERVRSEEHTSELQSQSNLVCRLLLEKKKKKNMKNEVKKTHKR